MINKINKNHFMIEVVFINLKKNKQTFIDTTKYRK